MWKLSRQIRYKGRIMRYGWWINTQQKPLLHSTLYLSETDLHELVTIDNITETTKRHAMPTHVTLPDKLIIKIQASIISDNYCGDTANMLFKLSPKEIEMMKMMYILEGS